MKELELPGGAVIEFPDDVSAGEMRDVASRFMEGQGDSPDSAPASAPASPRLFKNDVERRHVLWDESEDKHLRYEAAKGEFGDFDKGSALSTAEYAVRRLPLGLYGAWEKRHVRKAEEAFESGDFTTTDLFTLVQDEKQKEAESEKGLLRRGFDGATYVPGFMAEFFVGGGAAKGVWKGGRALWGAGRSIAARQAAKGAAKGSLKEAVKGGFKEAAEAGAKHGGRLALGGAARSGGRRTAELVGMSLGQGSLMVNRIWDNYETQRSMGRDFGTAIFNGWLESVTEVFTERLGGALFARGLPQGAGWITKKGPLYFRSAAKRFFEKKLGKTRYGKLLRAGGIDNIFSELMEERVGELMRRGFGTQEDAGVTEDLLSGNAAEAIDQLSVEFMSFMAPGAVKFVASKMVTEDFDKKAIDAVKNLDLDIDYLEKKKLERNREEYEKWKGTVDQPFGGPVRPNRTPEWITRPRGFEETVLGEEARDDRPKLFKPKLAEKSLDELPADAVEELKSKGYRLDRDEPAIEESAPQSETPGGKFKRGILNDRRKSAMKELDELPAGAVEELSKLGIDASRTEVAKAANIPREKVRDKAALIEAAKMKAGETGEGDGPLTVFRADGVSERIGKSSPRVDLKKIVKDSHEAVTKSQKEMAKFAEELGVRLRFFKSKLRLGKSRIRGFARGGVAYVQEGDSEDALWGIVGHEVSHASNIDELKEQFPEDLVERMQREYAGHSDPKRVSELSKDELYREGVAKIIQKYMTDKAFRDKLHEDSPSLWASARQALMDVTKGVSGETAGQRAALGVLRNQMAAKKFADIRVKERGDEISEYTGTDLRKEFSEAVRHVWEDKVQQHQLVELAKKVAKRRLKMNAKQAAAWENQGKDYSTVKNIDTVGREIATELGDLGGRMPVPPKGQEIDNNNYAEAVWNLVREPAKSSKPRRHDEEVLDEAEVMVIGKRSQDYVNPVDEMIQRISQGDVEGVDKTSFNQLVRDIVENEGVAEHEAKRKAVEALVLKQERDELSAERKAIADEENLDYEGPDTEGIPFSTERESLESRGVQFSEEASEETERIIQMINAMPNGARLAKAMSEGLKRVPTREEVESQRAHGWANVNTTLAGRQQQLLADLELGKEKRFDINELNRMAIRRLEGEGFEKEKNRFLDQFRDDDYAPFADPLDQFILSHIVERSSLVAAVEGGKAAYNRHKLLSDGLRMTRSGLGFQLRALRDPVSSDPVKVRKKALESMLLQAGDDIDQVKKLLGILKKMGIRLDDDSTLNNELAVVRALGVMRASQDSTYMDMLYEFYISSILSGPQTHTANLVGNVANMAWYNMVERTSEVVVSKMTRGKLSDDKEVRDFKELMHMYGAMGASLQEATMNALKTFWYENSVLNIQTSSESDNKYRTVPKHSIPGTMGDLLSQLTGKEARRAWNYVPLGKLVRSPLSFLGASDEFMRTIAAHGAASIHGYRIAKHELSDVEGTLSTREYKKRLSERMAELVRDKQSAAWAIAMQEASYQAFQQKGGVIGQKAKESFDNFKKVPYMGWGVKFLLPFTSFTTNAVGRMADMSPILGAVMGIVNDGHNGVKTNWNRVVANQVLGFVGLAATGWLLEDDDEEGRPRVTGHAERDWARRATQYRGIQPYSIRWMGEYFSYPRIEPFGGLLAAMVDFLNELKASDAEGVYLVKDSTMAALNSAAKVVEDKTYMQGFADLMKLSRGEEERAGVVLNVATGFVPNVYRQYQRESRNVIRESRPSVVGSIGTSAMIKAEIYGGDVADKIDAWGRPVRKNSLKTSFLWRVLSPVKRKDLKDMTGPDIAIAQWNEMKPDKEEVHFGVRDHKVSPKAKKLGHSDMTLEEYHTYCRESGEIALKLAVDNIKFSSPPTEYQMKLLKKAYAKGGEIAKKRMYARRNADKD